MSILTYMNFNALMRDFMDLHLFFSLSSYITNLGLYVLQNFILIYIYKNTRNQVDQLCLYNIFIKHKTFLSY